jgi:hypothetical protein
LESGESLNVKDGKANGFNTPTPSDGDSLFVTTLKDGRQIAISPKTQSVTRVENRYAWEGYKQDVDYKRGKYFSRVCTVNKEDIIQVHGDIRSM